MIVDGKTDHFIIHHEGVHNHLTPAPIHLSQEGEEKLREAVTNNPEASPMKIMTGTTGRDGIYKHDRALVHKNRVQRQRKKILEEVIGLDHQFSTVVQMVSELLEMTR